MENIAVLFSGQGAQYPGMMKDLVDCSKEAAEVFSIADRRLKRPISSISFMGEQDELNLTHNTQPCVLAADLAAYFALVNTCCMAPNAIAGFSLGEYAALVVGGVIEIQDAFPIIQNRADFMQEAVPVGVGAMAAIASASIEEVMALCEEAKGYVIPANINCPGQIVVSGMLEAVHSVVDTAKSRGIKAMLLPVSAPFHSELLEPAARKLEKVLRQYRFDDSAINLYLNVDGEKETSGTIIKEKLVLQAKSPVYWEKTLRNMYKDGIRVFVECGPGKTLSGFVKKTFRGFDDVVSLRVSDVETLQSTVEYFKENS